MKHHGPTAILVKRTATFGRLGSMALAALLLLQPAVSSAQAPAATQAELEELRREVRTLRSQVDGLRAAILESAEANREAAASLSRAVRGAPTLGEAPASGPTKSDGAGADPTTRPAPGGSKGAPAARAAAPAAPVTAARKRPEPVAGGSIRGKVELPSGEPVAYVYVENVPGPIVRDKVKIEQQRKQFIPAWAVVQRGTTIEFPNLDSIYHNVFSLSSGNTFDLGLYNASGEAKAHTFLEPGSVDIYCNIHPQMAASVLVVPNRLYAKVKTDGSFQIDDVPAGRRKVVAWSPGSKLSSQWVQVDAGGDAQVSLKLDTKAGAHKNKFGRAYGSYE